MGEIRKKFTAVPYKEKTLRQLKSDLIFAQQTVGAIFERLLAHRKGIELLNDEGLEYLEKREIELLDGEDLQYLEKREDELRLFIKELYKAIKERGI